MIDAHFRLSQAPFFSEERVAQAGLATLVVVAIALRLAAFLLVPSLNWADEIFQVVEQAHRLVYGNGLVPWEFQLVPVPGYCRALSLD